MTENEKKHTTALRILEVLKILLDNEISKNELIVRLKNAGKVESVYTYEAISKYFNTMELFGFKIDKEKNKYRLNNALTKIDLTKEEEKVLLKLLDNIYALNNKSAENNLFRLFKKLDKYFDTDIISNLEAVRAKNKLIHNNNVKANIVTTLKNMIYENMDVLITYRKSNGTEENVTVVLKEVVEKDGNIFIVFYDKNILRNKRININSILKIEQLPTKVKGQEMLNSIVFEVYGRLFRSYKLRLGEQSLTFSNNYMSITNSSEDKDALLLRLLKYADNCKIVKPQAVREEFLALTDKMLKNLEE